MSNARPMAPNDRFELGLRKAQALAQRGELTVSALEQIFARIPGSSNSSRYLLLLAGCQARHGEASLAVITARKCLDIDPSDVKARSLLIQALLQSGDHKEASRYLLGVASYNGVPVRTLAELAASAYRLGEYKTAADMLESAVLMAPNSCNVRLSAAQAYGAMGEIDAARGHLDCIRPYSDNIMLSLYSGVLNQKIGMLDEALRDFSDALDRNHGSDGEISGSGKSRALLGKIQCLVGMGRYAEAIASLSDPPVSLPPLQVNRLSGSCFLGLNLWDKAFDSAKAALSVAISDAEKTNLSNEQAEEIHSLLSQIAQISPQANHQDDLRAHAEAALALLDRISERKAELISVPA